MSYKDLLDKYKEDSLSLEEKKKIEAEIEKHEALEDYLAEGLDEILEADMTAIDSEAQKKETLKLKKSVNNKLKKIIISSLIAGIIIFKLIFNIMSCIVDQLYYDPMSIIQSENREYPVSNFNYDMSALVDMRIPGYKIDLTTSEERKGFARYDLVFSMIDLFSEKNNNYYAKIKRGKYIYETNNILNVKNNSDIWRGFDIVRYPYLYKPVEGKISMVKEANIKNNEKTIQYLNQLNPLTYISMSLVFDQDKNMEEIYHIMKENPKLSFKWIGIRTIKEENIKEDKYVHLLGFNPDLNDQGSVIVKPNIEKYPLFNLNDFHKYYLKYFDTNKIADIYETYGMHFRSRLSYLADQKDFIEIFDNNYDGTNLYTEAISYIDQNGVKTYGVLIYANAQDLLEAIDDISYRSIYINKALPIRTNLYR